MNTIALIILVIALSISAVIFHRITDKATERDIYMEYDRSSLTAYNYYEIYRKIYLKNFAITFSGLVILVLAIFYIIYQFKF